MIEHIPFFVFGLLLGSTLHLGPKKPVQKTPKKDPNSFVVTGRLLDRLVSQETPGTNNGPGKKQ